MLIPSILILFGLLTWRRLETGVLLVCALLPSYLIRFDIFGVPTTFLEMMVLIVVGVWGFKKSRGVVESWSEGRGSFFDLLKKNLAASITPRLHDSTTPSLCLLLLLAAIIGIFISPDKFAAIGVWKAYFVEPILFFFVLVDVMGAHKGHPYQRIVHKIFCALGISALFVSLFGIVQWIFQIGIPIPWDIERRITSVFPYPNAVALFLEPIVVLSWFKITSPSFTRRGSGGGRAELFFWLSTCLLSIVAIILAQSEAALAALAITALVFLWMIGKKKIVLTLLVSFGFLWIFLTSSIVPSLITAPGLKPWATTFFINTHNKLTFQDFSEQVRLSQWRETIDLIKDRPLFGAGLSGYPIVMKNYHRDTQYEIFQYPHNIILNIWVELGLLGLIAFGWLMYIVLSYGVMELWSEGVLNFFIFSKKIKTSSFTPRLNDSTTLSLVFLVTLLHGLVDVPYFKNDLAMMFWILMACFVATSTHNKHNQGFHLR